MRVGDGSGEEGGAADEGEERVHHVQVVLYDGCEGVARAEVLEGEGGRWAGSVGEHGVFGLAVSTAGVEGSESVYVT